MLLTRSEIEALTNPETQEKLRKLIEDELKAINEEIDKEEQKHEEDSDAVSERI